MSLHAQGVAVVTGASSGIGAAYAERLARRGYDLTIVDDKRKRLDALAAQHGLDAAVAEAPVPPMSDRRRLRPFQQRHHFGADLRRARRDLVFRHK